MWRAIRRPLLLLFATGLTLSLSSSGRVSVRTTVDGMISFAFLPITETLAVGVVYLRGDRRRPFVSVLDTFFLSNAPWMLWLLGFCAWHAGFDTSTISFGAVKIVLLSLLVPALWAAYLDLHFFRLVLPRASSGSEWVDLLTARAIGWVSAVGYFLGIALWAQIVAWFR